jgi:hypothetical protein
MERFIQHIKDRTECFDDHFPCKSHGCNRKHICNWLQQNYLTKGSFKQGYIDILNEESEKLFTSLEKMLVDEVIDQYEYKTSVSSSSLPMLQFDNEQQQESSS